MPKTDKVPRSVINHLIKAARQDPQLPRPGPTEAFWQIPEADISNIQSPKLPDDPFTYAIIGSGITACSVAKNLLELDPDSRSRVIVFEARSLCSGATGRNGGHLLSPLPEEFTLFEKALGKDETTKIARFANRTLESMHRLGEEVPAAEVRKVRSVCGYYDLESFELAKRSHQRYEECLPEWEGDHQVFNAEEAVEKFNMKNTVGVITNSAGAFWPYRLVTGVYSQMLKRYPDRFFIETNTPVTKVQTKQSCTGKDRYRLTTPRGTKDCAYVIHCTNGWSGHLLRWLRGKIFPLRGTMSVQEAGPELPHEGDKKSWSTISSPRYNKKDGTFFYGLYYITQNAKSGDIFIGGEKQKAEEILTSDDTTMSPTSKNTLENVLPTIYEKGWPSEQKPNIRKIWSGIMGFTPDHMPWIGQLPHSITRHGRDLGGEYIAAGFNGYGMPMCWGAGEAVAKMILGSTAGKLGEDKVAEDVMDWLPESFLITEKRLESPYTSVEFGLGLMLGECLGWWGEGYLLGWFVVGVVMRWMKRWVMLLGRIGRW